MSPRSGSASAPSAAAAAALLYLAAHGARTPFLALFGLKRLPNLVVALAPYAIVVPVALALSGRLDAATATGLMAVAIAPGPLLAPSVVTAAGGRRADMAGALGLGTAIVSLVLALLWPGANAAALVAAQTFAIASLVAGAVPTVRDRLLVVIRWIGHLAALAVIALAILAGPPVGALDVAVALAAVGGAAVTAGVAALLLRRDVLSAVIAAGLRDPIVAIALAWSVGGSAATAVPLASTAILGIAAAALVIRRR